MNIEQFLTILCGFGLLLFALRYLTSALDSSLSRRIRPLLTPLTRTSARCFITGLLTTLCVQASSVTILTAMGLLNRGLISLEQALFIMLGATIGSTLKAGFGSQIWVYLGPLLIAVASLSYFLFSVTWKKQLSEVLLSIGMTLIALEMIEKGLIQIMNIDAIGSWIPSHTPLNTLEILQSVGIGAFSAFALQSSSSILLSVMNLVHTMPEILSSGVALILGANIGTTSTALIASISQTQDAKRLALAHLAVKCSGALFVILFFNTHLITVENLLNFFGRERSPEAHIATFNLLFNVMNSLTWCLFLPVLVKLSKTLIPDSPLKSRIPFSLGVQNLLLRMPAHLDREAEAELKETIRDLFFQIEGLFECLLELEQPEKKKKMIGLLQKRSRLTHSSLSNIKLLLFKATASDSLEHESQVFSSHLFYLCEHLSFLNDQMSDFLDQLQTDWLDDPISYGQVCNTTHFKRLQNEMGQTLQRIFHHSLRSSQTPVPFFKSQMDFDTTQLVQNSYVFFEMLHLSLKRLEQEMTPPSPSHFPHDSSDEKHSHSVVFSPLSSSSHPRSEPSSFSSSSSSSLRTSLFWRLNVKQNHRINTNDL